MQSHVCFSDNYPQGTFSAEPAVFPASPFGATREAGDEGAGRNPAAPRSTEGEAPACWEVGRSRERAEQARWPCAPCVLPPEKDPSKAGPAAKPATLRAASAGRPLHLALGRRAPRVFGSPRRAPGGCRDRALLRARGRSPRGALGTGALYLGVRDGTDSPSRRCLRPPLPRNRK